MQNLDMQSRNEDFLDKAKSVYPKFSYDAFSVAGSLRAANNCQDITFFEEVFENSWSIIKHSTFFGIGEQVDWAGLENDLLTLHFYQKGNYEAILDLVHKTPFVNRKRLLHEWKARALVRTDRIDALEMYLDSVDYSRRMLITSWAELFRMGKIERTKSFLNNYQEYWEDDLNTQRFSYMLHEDWKAAETALLEQLNRPNANRNSVSDGYLGMVYALSGQTIKAEEIIRKIEEKEYDDPKWDIYNVGRILALLGRDKEAFAKLKEAFSKQMSFSNLVYNFDLYLLRYWDYEPF